MRAPFLSFVKALASSSPSLNSQPSTLNQHNYPPGVPPIEPLGLQEEPMPGTSGISARPRSVVCIAG